MNTGLTRGGGKAGARGLKSSLSLSRGEGVSPPSN